MQCQVHVDATETQISELTKILEHPDLERHFGVNINCTELANEHTDVVRELVRQPDTMLCVLDNSLRQAQQLLPQTSPSSSPEEVHVKSLVHARLHGLPYTHDTDGVLSPQPSTVSACHTGKLLTLTGAICRAQSIQLFEAYRIVECCKCQSPIRLQACITNPQHFEPPAHCPRPACGNTSFRPVEQASVGYTNYQEVSIQDAGSAEGKTRLPRGFPVVLLHDLVESCQVGDRVEITGTILQQSQGPLPSNGNVASLRLLLLACHVHTCTPCAELPNPLAPSPAAMFERFWNGFAASPLAGRAVIVNSVCPRLCHVYDVKLALLLVLLGGVPVAHEATPTRGESHMLLIGDPGTGKSQIMKYAARLAPRAVVTTGRGTTHAGLTAAAVKEGTQWTLSAGALPMANGGICCIDEFGDVPATERVALLEAMEQQIISVAKAGMVTQLAARTSVLAAMNPVRAFDATRSLESNTGLPPPLLSRFDVVLALIDGVNEARDSAMADHILRLEGTSEGADGSGTCDGESADVAPAAGLWSTGQLREYVAWARSTFSPVVTPAARAVLQAYFQKQRAAASFNGRAGGDRATVRLLEGLVRLSQAHARLLARHCVTEQDAAAVLLLMERCANTAPVLGGGGGGTLCSCELLDEEHAAVVRQLMDRLGLQGGPGGGGSRGASVWGAGAEASEAENKRGFNEGRKVARVEPSQPQAKWEGRQRGESMMATTASHCKLAAGMPPPPLPLRAPSAPAGGCTGAATERGGEDWAGATAQPPRELSIRQGPPVTRTPAAGGAVAARLAIQAAGGTRSGAAVLDAGHVRQVVRTSTQHAAHALCGAARTAADREGGTAVGANRGTIAPPLWAGRAHHAASAPVKEGGSQAGPSIRSSVPSHAHALDLLHLGCRGQGGIADRGDSMPLSEVPCNVRPAHGSSGAAISAPQGRATSAPVFHFNTHEEEIDLSDIL